MIDKEETMFLLVAVYNTEANQEDYTEVIGNFKTKEEAKHKKNLLEKQHKAIGDWREIEYEIIQLKNY